MDLIRMAANQTSPCVCSAFSAEQTTLVRRLHRMVPGYDGTPLADLKALAQRLGVHAVLVKDESKRFGLNAFKGLGGIYAMFRIICRELALDPEKTSLSDLLTGENHDGISRMVFITTTDGNHGKGVSWAAGVFGCRAYVYMPKGTVEVRAQAIRDAGNAQVQITDMRYDDCVAWTRALAEEKGWFLIQDTAWPGYEEVPLWIMQGYTTLLEEASAQMRALGYRAPSHLFLQAGVGSMAAAIAAGAAGRFENAPLISVVEPHEAACFYESFAAGDGLPHKASGSAQTLMAGLNCAVPCSIAWDLLRSTASFAFSCDDEITRRGMRLLGRPAGNDPLIISGESGAVTAGLLDALMTEPACAAMRDALGLNSDSVVLLISTEGNTDPEDYQKVLASV